MKLLVIDGNSIINRAFYGIRLLSTAEGIFTNGIYGFLNILFREAEAEKPDGIVAAFDLRAPTFRHLKYDGYKAQRKGMPDELAMQMPLLKEILTAMGVLCLEKEGYEADDIIGTIAAMCDKSGDKCVILTGDKDDLQLVSENTTCKLTITRMGKNESTAFTPSEFFERYGFTPEKMVDLKALWGDTSDNIPGVAGIGEKSATELVQKYGTVENIYANIDSLDIRESMKTKLIAGKESAFLSYELATIFKEVPLGIDIKDMQLREADYPRLLTLYTKLEFRQFADKIRDKAAEAATHKDSDFTYPEAITVTDADMLCEILAKADKLYIVFENEGALSFFSDKLYTLSALETVDFKRCADMIIASECKKCVHDAKGLLTFFAESNINVDSFVFDTMLAAYLINPAASSYSPVGLASEYLDTNITEFSCSAAILPSLEEKLMARLEELSMINLFKEIELPLSFVLYEMEQKGVMLDSDHLAQFGKTLSAQLAQYTEAIFAFAGEEFNINSPKQLGTILFEKLGLPGGKKSKTGSYKTDADTLSHLKSYPIVSAILNFRQYSKLLSTYVDGLLKVVDPADMRIHSTFNQTVTVTGRISSAEPNLQNIPVRTELGRDMRKMFIADEGNILVDADYSQIELRVLAALAGDENMKEAFLSGQDIHAVTASQVFGIPLSLVTDDMRRKAKAVNFGIVYGISAFSLADDIGTSVKEAKDYISAYFETYSGVKAFLDKTVSDAKENGFVTTAFNRRRLLPELKSSNFNLRSFGERAAMNTPIQGTAADIIKLAMVKVQSRLKREGLSARLVLQVHDELIIEAPLAEKEAAAKILREEMENVCSLAVPLVAEVGTGRTWFEAK